MVAGESDRGAEVVAQVVAELLSLPVVAEPERLAGGYGNESWLVRVADLGRVLLRIAHDGADAEKVRASWRAHEMALSAGVPTGRQLIFAERCEQLGGRAIRLVEYVDGLDAREVLASEANVAVFFGSLGELLRRLHGVGLDRFSSRVGGSAPSFASWRDYVEHRTASIARRGLQAGAFSSRELEQILSGLVDLSDRVARVVEPALTHRDLHLGNLLASENGGVRAILDWDGAEAWDPLVDFVKLRWQVLPAYPDAEDALWSTYAPEGPPAMLRERLQIVDVLELTNGVSNARIDGEREYEDLQRQWLAASKAEFGR